MSSRRTRLRAAIAAILTVLMLGPAGVLFARVWQDDVDRRNTTTLERAGVAYLTALTPLLNALAESESSAVQGATATPSSLPAAVTGISDIDNRLGDRLHTRQRWAGLREQIGTLTASPGTPVPKPGSGGPAAAYQLHVEVADLTVALYDAVRRHSALSRDPDVDVSNLQTAAAVDLPATFVQVGRLGDLARMVAKATGPDRAPLSAQFGQAALATQASVDRLTGDLQAAADDTSSDTLSGNLVSSLDSFRHGVETMIQAANPGGAADLNAIGSAQGALQTALTGLAGVAYAEMSKLLDARIAALDSRRTEALALGGGALVLALAALLVALPGRRRDVSPPAAPTGPYGEPAPTRRERTGALR